MVNKWRKTHRNAAPYRALRSSKVAEEITNHFGVKLEEIK